jgi:hypothetical protein
MHVSWKTRLKPEFAKDYFKALTAFVETERRNHTVYPPAGEVFAAFDLTPFDAVRVVILGQDPYFRPGQAHGLAFSVRPGGGHRRLVSGSRQPHPLGQAGRFPPQHDPLGWAGTEKVRGSLWLILTTSENGEPPKATTPPAEARSTQGVAFLFILSC